MHSLGAPILTLDEFAKIRPTLGRVVAVSGGFDPIHPGHISNIIEAKKLGETLVVIVNGDNFLRTKKGKEFQDLRTRCLIVSAISAADYVIPFEIEGDTTVSKALEVIHPTIFAKGGDRSSPEKMPEWELCQRLGIQIVFGVGLDKEWSSSWFLKEWEDFARGRD